MPLHVVWYACIPLFKCHERCWYKSNVQVHVSNHGRQIVQYTWTIHLLLTHAMASAQLVQTRDYALYSASTLTSIHVYCLHINTDRMQPTEQGSKISYIYTLFCVQLWKFQMVFFRPCRVRVGYRYAQYVSETIWQLVASDCDKLREAINWERDRERERF